MILNVRMGFMCFTAIAYGEPNSATANGTYMQTQTRQNYSGHTRLYVRLGKTVDSVHPDTSGVLEADDR